MCTPFHGLSFSLLFTHNRLCFTVTTQPGSKRPFGSVLSELLPLRVVDDAVTLEALLHGESLRAAREGAGKGPQLLVEGADVALEVEDCGE